MQVPKQSVILYSSVNCGCCEEASSVEVGQRRGVEMKILIFFRLGDYLFYYQGEKENEA